MRSDSQRNILSEKALSRTLSPRPCHTNDQRGATNSLLVDPTGTAKGLHYQRQAVYAVVLGHEATAPEMDNFNEVRNFSISLRLPSVHAGQPALNPSTIVEVCTSKQLQQMSFINARSAVEPK